MYKEAMNKLEAHLKAILISGFLALLAVSSAQAVEGDIIRTHNYGGASDEFGQSLELISNGGYIITGSTGSYGAGGFDFYLVRTDEQGNQIAILPLGGPGNEIANASQQNPDHGFIVAGSTDYYGAGSEDVYLVRTRASGHTLWAEAFGGPASDSAQAVLTTSDGGGFVAAGYTYSYGAGGCDFYLIKVDLLGNMVWEQTFGGPGHDMAFSLEETSDGGFILAGSSDSFGGGDLDIYMVKTDSNGILMWEQVFGGPGNEEAYSAQETLDGDFIIAGQTDSFGAGGTDVYLIRTDSSGTELWSQTYGGPGDDGARSVLQTFHEGFLAVGYTYSFGAGDSDFYIVKADSSGNELWTQTCGDVGADAANSIVQNSYGNYMVAGTTTFPSSGGHDIFMVEIGGEQTVSLSVSVVDPPAIIPSTGGIFYVNGSATNYTFDNLLLQAWAMVDVPGFGTMGPFHLMNVVVPAKSTIYRYNIPGKVPRGAPAGLYTVWPFIGHYPDSTLDFDLFTFQKLP